MTYRVYVGNWGSECVVGEIPDNIWKYIQDECDGDCSTYRDKLENGEVPDDLMLADGLPGLTLVQIIPQYTLDIQG